MTRILGEKYDFVWNMTVSPDGKDIAVNIKKDNEFGISLNGISWDNKFVEARDVIISPNGKRTASRVKKRELPHWISSALPRKF